jgi:hypothetical protein
MVRLLYLSRQFCCGMTREATKRSREMLKKLLAFVFVLVLSMSITGCDIFRAPGSSSESTTEQPPVVQTVVVEVPVEVEKIVEVEVEKVVERTVVVEVQANGPTPTPTVAPVDLPDLANLQACLNTNANSVGGLTCADWRLPDPTLLAACSNLDKIQDKDGKVTDCTALRKKQEQLVPVYQSLGFPVTGMVVGTPAAAGTRAAADAEGLVFAAGGPAPELHHADSHAPEEGVGSFDIGVEPGQVGLVFGVHIFWPAGNLDAGGDGCDLVILDPGFYPDLAIEDARYEVYTLPQKDWDGWITSLATLRAEEQARHYGCPSTMEHVQVWSADPHMESWATRRRASGVDYVIPFYKGDRVYGFSIYNVVPTYTEGVGHSPAPICDGGGCYLESAPYDGACGGCVINSWWEGEVPPNPAQPVNPTNR